MRPYEIGEGRDYVTYSAFMADLPFIKRPPWWRRIWNWILPPKLVEAVTVDLSGKDDLPDISQVTEKMRKTFGMVQVPKSFKPSSYQDLLNDLNKRGMKIAYIIGPSRDKKKEMTCPHGVERGEFCTKCYEEANQH